MANTRQRSNGRKSVKRAVAKRVASAPSPAADAGEGQPPFRASYDAFKEHEGKRYTGMKIGRGHKWRYDAGEWIEKKVTPDKWEFRYAVTKRRTGKAPEGSGAPVGTAYRWYILADQVVTKLDANSYTTEMVGVKYKLAHKRAEKESWSASERAQRKQLIKLLREMVAELEAPAAETETPRAAPQPEPDEQQPLLH